MFNHVVGVAALHDPHGGSAWNRKNFSTAKTALTYVGAHVFECHLRSLNNLELDRWCRSNQAKLSQNISYAHRLFLPFKPYDPNYLMMS